MRDNNIKNHVDTLQNVAIDTVTNPIKDVVKLAIGVLGLSFSLAKGLGDKIIKTISKE